MFRAMLFLLACLLACAQLFAVTLVQDGKPEATIIIAEAAYNAQPYTRALWGTGTPEQKIRAAASDLQHYLEKISGAKLEILSDAMKINLIGQPVILVGESNATKLLKLKYPTGVTKDFNEDGYTIYCKGETLALVGNDAGPYHGTEYAVFDLLNRLGARWFMPTAYGEYLPRLETVTVNELNVTERPDFRQRGWWQNSTPEMSAQDAEFRIRNRMQFNPPIIIAGDSSLRQWMPDAELLKTKPELFAKQADGSYSPHMINLTHPDTPRLVAEKMKAEMKKQVEKGVLIPQVSIAPDDGAPIDYTPETMKNNSGFTELAGRLNVPTEVSISEEWFRFMNKVAEEVAKDYPDSLILTNGYSNRNIPPEGVALHPNLGVMYAAIWADVLHPYNSPKSWQTNAKGQIMQRWCELNSRVYIYDYDMQMLVTGITPVPQVHNLRVNMPLMKKWGLAGFWSEARTTWMEEGIPTKYLRSRMMWDADLNVDAVLDEYFAAWYGKAAKPMKTFWGALEVAMESTDLLGHEDRVLPFVYTPELMIRLELAVREAEKLPTDARTREHVKIDRLILEHLKAYMAMHAAEFDGKYAEAAKQGEAMWAIRGQLEKISPFLCITTSTNRYLNSGETYWGAQDRIAHYRKVDDMLTGKTGKLVAMAPRQVKFRLDNADLGRIERWQDPGFSRKGWQTVDTCKPFYLQVPGGLGERNFPYQGYMWYVFELNVPASAKDQPLTLYSPIVVDDAWVWVNGTFAVHRGHIEPYCRPAELQYDVTDLIQPGKKNVIAVRVSTGFCPAAVADGFMGRLFLYTPVKE
ncbi:MAG: DUF4838 domain-containing protein [Armatimonadota bacterium]